MISIHKIVNSPITSNCYIIANLNNKSCFVVDPGSIDDELLINYLYSNRLIVTGVILTHEHFGHISGVNRLSSKFQFQLICSKEAALGLINSKMNLSAFDDQIQPVVINIIPRIVKDNEQMIFGNNKLSFYYTPGHSAGSMCFRIGNYFFTGDTLLHNQKTRLNLPGSNKNEYADSVKKLNFLIEPFMQIYPGHGDCFIYTSKYTIMNEFTKNCLNQNNNI